MAPMRIVTWNCCRGAYARKAPLLDPLAPDIAVIQEVAQPERQSPRCLWFGDNPRQGVAVQAAPPYRLRALPPVAGVPRYVVPVAVTGPKRFTLFAVWAKGKQVDPYVEGVLKAAALYPSMTGSPPSVLIGDLNSNALWDSSHKPGRSHSALVALLAERGLVSAYHSYFQEAHGRETLPTYYFLWKEERPYHLDYCFLPRRWARTIQRVEVGGYEEWQRHSDHRPLLVEI